GVGASYDNGASAPRRRPWRSTGAVAAGFVAVVVLSLGTDQVLHWLQVYPPWGQPMAGSLFLLATAYRVVFSVAGGYITARLAPHARVRHALILGFVGLLPGIAGIMVAIAKPGLGPKGSVMSCTFQLEGQDFYALNGGPQFTFTPAISLFVNSETQQEVDQLWEKLSAGGSKDQCGWLKDKFGVSWQIVPTVLGK